MAFFKRIFALLTGRIKRARSGGNGVFQAAPDMTEYLRVRELVHWADDELERGNVTELILDLSQLVRMNTSFLAGVVLVCRRARTHAVAVRIKHFPKHFETLVDLYRVRGALREAGVIFEDPLDEDEAAALINLDESTTAE